MFIGAGSMIMTKSFFQPEPRVLAHRGLSIEYPENTILSFRKAAELDVDVIETDVHLTNDNQFVVIHDDRLERLSDGGGRVSDYTLAALQQFDAAYHFTLDGGKRFPYRGSGITFLSLDELLEEFPEQRFNIDLKIKNPDLVDNYAAIIRKHHAETRVLTASEHRINLMKMRSQIPEMATSFSMGEVIAFFALFKTGFLFCKKSFVGDALQIPEFIGPSRIVTPSFVREAHERMIRVHVWTVNEEHDMRRLLDAGVDGIFTDDARRLQRVLEDYSR